MYFVCCSSEIHKEVRIPVEFAKTQPHVCGRSAEAYLARKAERTSPPEVEIKNTKEVASCAVKIEGCKQVRVRPEAEVWRLLTRV